MRRNVASVKRPRLASTAAMCSASSRTEAQPMEERVTCRIEDGVADVRLNRPEKMNALDAAMFRAIVETGERLKHDRSVRAVVLSGEGRAFCAGLDMGSFQKMAEKGAGGVDGDLTARP